MWDNVVQYLKDEQPDIVTLQEVFAGGKPEGPPHLRTLPALQEALGYGYAEFGLESFLDNGQVEADFGNGILSKLPLMEPKVEWIHGSGPRKVDDRDRQQVPNFPRNILHCKMEAGGQNYNVMSLHGVWAFDRQETGLQKAMGKKISEYVSGKSNVILAGDFNVNENTEAVNSVEQHLVNIFKGQRQSSFNMRQKTSPGYASAIVDFVFASPQIKVLEHYSSDADVSDHQSQVVVFDL